MLSIRPENINSWKNPKQIFIKENNEWKEVKKFYQSSASWNLAWHYNFYPQVGENHEFLTTTQNAEFKMQEPYVTYENYNDSLNYTTFWGSAPRSFTIDNGKLSINIIQPSLTQVDENKKMYFSCVNGSASLTILNNEFSDFRLTSEISPVAEENQNGSASVLWELYQYPENLFFSSSPVYIRAFASASVVVVTQPARFTSSDENGRIGRSYYRYFGNARIQPYKALKVQPGQVYKIQTNLLNTLDTVRQSYTLGATYSDQPEPDFFQVGTFYVESPQTSSSGFYEYELTISASAFAIRPVVTAYVNYKVSQHITPVPIRSFEFDYFRVKRVT